MKVWVVSWVYWNGPDQGGGGFWWYPDRQAALRAFGAEKEAWAGATARVRLVEVEVPDALGPEWGKGYDSATMTPHIDGINQLIAAIGNAIRRESN